MVNRVVSETERVKIQGYPARKWGFDELTVFSGSHPYYSTDPYQPTVTQGGEDATDLLLGRTNNPRTGDSKRLQLGQQRSNFQPTASAWFPKALTGLTKGTTHITPPR